MFRLNRPWSLRWAVLPILLGIMLAGCFSQPAVAPGRTPRPTPSPSELLRRSHQRMLATESFTAKAMVHLQGEGETGRVRMDLRRAGEGSASASVDIDTPGLKDSLEIVLAGGYWYANQGGRGWTRKPAGELTDLGESAAWAVQVASNLDFFGGLIPREQVTWDIYGARLFGQEEISGSPVQHIQLETDLAERWSELGQADRERFILSRVLMVQPQELIDQSQTETMDLWLDGAGYVRKMRLGMVLASGLAIDMEITGSGFGEEVEIRVPSLLAADLPAQVALPGVPAETRGTADSPGELPTATPGPGATPGVISQSPDEPATEPTDDFSAVPAIVEPPISRREIQAMLGLGVSLRGRNLAGADLSYANLSGAALQGTNLAGVKFYAADLSWSVLRLANLEGADLRRADLRYSDLRLASLLGASLAELDLEGARLDGTNLAGLDLNRAYLGMASLVDVDLSDADLGRVHLAEADLTGANLARANLSGANLSGAVLTNTDLSDADLSGADLTGARLNGAILLGADLSNADLTDANILYSDINAAEFSGATLESTFFGEGTAYRKAFCDDVHRCSSEVLKERGALLNN